MKDLPIRTLVAVVLLALLAAVLIFGGWVQAAVLGAFSVIGVLEVQNVFRKKELKPFIIPQAILGGGMFLLLFTLPTIYAFCAFVLAFLAVAVERILNKNRTNADVAASLAVFAYPLLPFAFFGLVGFRAGADGALSRIALLSVFASVIMADNAAYMVGSLIGKKKLCPAISPNKTVEGGVAGLVGGALGGVIAYFAQFLWLESSLIPLHFMIIICFIAGLIGQFGDLFASTFKRWAGIKDFGNLFPGHGGILDRLDSALFAAPVIYFAFALLYGSFNTLNICF